MDVYVDTLSYRYAIYLWTFIIVSVNISRLVTLKLSMSPWQSCLVLILECPTNSKIFGYYFHLQNRQTAQSWSLIMREVLLYVRFCFADAIDIELVPRVKEFPSLTQMEVPSKVRAMIVVDTEMFIACSKSNLVLVFEANTEEFQMSFVVAGLSDPSLYGCNQRVPLHQRIHAWHNISSSSEGQVEIRATGISRHGDGSDFVFNGARHHSCSSGFWIRARTRIDNWWLFLRRDTDTKNQSALWDDWIVSSCWDLWFKFE